MPLKMFRGQRRARLRNEESLSLVHRHSWELSFQSPQGVDIALASLFFLPMGIRYLVRLLKGALGDVKPSWPGVRRGGARHGLDMLTKGKLENICKCLVLWVWNCGTGVGRAGGRNCKETQQGKGECMLLARVGRTRGRCQTGVCMCSDAPFKVIRPSHACISTLHCLTVGTRYFCSGRS